MPDPVLATTQPPQQQQPPRPAQQPQFHNHQQRQEMLPLVDPRLESWVWPDAAPAQPPPVEWHAFNAVAEQQPLPPQQGDISLLGLQKGITFTGADAAAANDVPKNGDAPASDEQGSGSLEFGATAADFARKLAEKDKKPAWYIPYEELSLGQKIGRGAFGDVLLAEWHGTSVAVKRLQNVHPSAHSDFRREVGLLHKLRHPNVILFMGACTSPTQELCIIMEHAANGSLYGVLRRKATITFDGDTIVRWATEMARGMNYLHTRSPPILHRDLKSGNVLVDEDWHLRVSDFGLARIRAGSTCQTQVGTWGWMAPEVLEHGSYDEKADVYSYAIVLWEMVARDEPFKGMHPMQVAKAVDRGERPPMPAAEDACPRGYRSLIEQCWHSKPQARPSFEDILKMLKK